MFNDSIHGSNTFITSLKVALPKESQFSNHNPLLLFQQTSVRLQSNADRYDAVKLFPFVLLSYFQRIPRKTKRDVET